MQRSDLAPLAVYFTDAAALFAARAPYAWDKTKEWQAGPAAANLDPGRGHGAVSDPTGRAALTADLDPHAQLEHCVLACRAAWINLTDVLHRVGPPPAPPPRWCAWMLEAGSYEEADYTVDGQPACQWIYRRYRRDGHIPTLDDRRRRARTRDQNDQTTMTRNEPHSRLASRQARP